MAWRGRRAVKMIAAAALALAFTPRVHAGLVASIDRMTGEVGLATDGTGPVSITGYALLSNVGALDPASWRSIAHFGDIDSGGPEPGDYIDADDLWVVFASSLHELAETTLGELTIENGQAVPVGAAFLRGPYEDIALQYLLADGTAHNGSVDYLGPTSITGDLNFDGELTLADWMIYKPDFGKDLSAMTQPQAYQMGDLNGDLMNNDADFRILKDALLAAGVAVPEPASMGLLLALAGFGGLTRRRTGRQATRYNVNEPKWKGSRDL